MPEDNHSEHLQIKVTPNAGRNAIAGFIDGVMQVKISSPPVKGKANRELIVFLSKLLGVNKTAITIVKGLTGRNKTVTVDNMAREEMIKRLMT